MASLEGFLDALASAEPVPGGGAAAGVAASLGAALVCMVCNLTIGRERFREHEPRLIEIRDEADGLRLRALELADEDARVYASLRAAYALPKDDEGRPPAIQTALRAATEVPLQTAELAGRVLALCDDVLPRGNPNLLSDIHVAAAISRGARDGAAVLVRGNLSQILDESFRSACEARLP